MTTGRSEEEIAPYLGISQLLQHQNDLTLHTKKGE